MNVPPDYLAMIREQLKIRMDLDVAEAWQMLLWSSVLPGKRLETASVTPPAGLYDEAAVQRLVRLAQEGDGTADQVVCAVAAHYLHFGQMPGQPLKDYVVDKLGHLALGKAWIPAKKGPPHNIQRDIVIAAVIMMIACDLDVKPTRSPASSSQCACSIIAEATRDSPEPISEAAAAKIWTRYRRFPAIATAASEAISPPSASFD